MRVAVRGPERSERVAGREREPRVHAAREVPDPDVGPCPARGPRGRTRAGRRAERRPGSPYSPGSPSVSSSFPERSTQRMRFPRFARAVGEHAVARHREAREADRVRADLLGERDRLARRLHGLRVERLRDERPVAHEEEIARRRVGDERLRRRERLRLRRVERADPVRAVVRLLVDRHVEEVAAVRQKLRPADLHLLARGVRLDGDGGRSARGRDALDRIVARAVEEDHALRAPGPVGARRRVADLLRRPARDVDLLELAVREEAEEPAVGRPEGARRSLRAGERLRRRARSAAGSRSGSCPRASVALKARIRPSGEMRGRVDRRDGFGGRDLEPDEPRRLRARGATKPRREPPRRAASAAATRPREPLAVLAPRRDGRGQARLRAALRDPLELQLARRAPSGTGPRGPSRGTS